MGVSSTIPKKSPNDERQYEGIELQNQIKILLIHDPTTIKSACSVSIGVGSLEDPDHALGLAHFLQHMIFMGSKNYPDHTQYTLYISNNSGEADGHTDDDETNFFFSVKNSAFQMAIKRLTDTLINPLLLDHCIEKEIQAVHEEYVIESDSDEGRIHEIVRKLASEPFNRFTIGNKSTLQYENVREDLKIFYEKYYSSNIMKIVLCSSLSLENMKETLVPYFKQIPNKKIKPMKYPKHYQIGDLGKLIKVQSIQDESKMEFIWILDNIRGKYKQHVEDYLLKILGTNTLIVALEQEGYASDCSSSSIHIQSQTMVKMEIELTEEGQDEYEEVYNIVMDFIEKLEPSQQVFDQLRQLQEKQFEFKERQQQLSEEVCELSSLMHHIPLTQILSYQSQFDKFHEEAIASALKELKQTNLIVVLSSDNYVKGMKEEKYLGGKYKVEKLPRRKKTKIKFASPSPNALLPINTYLYNNQRQNQNGPEKIQNIYFQQRGKFNVCKGGIKLLVHSCEDYVFKQFYADYLEDILQPALANGYSLNTNIDIYADHEFMIEIYGFNDIVYKLFNKMKNSFWQAHDSEDSKDSFETILDDLEAGYDNFYCDEADELAEEIRDLILIENYPTIKELKKTVQDYKYQEFRQRVKDFWKTCKMQWIVVGNFQKSSTVFLIQQFQKVLKSTPETEVRKAGCLKLEDNIRFEAYLSSEQMQSSCCFVYFQAGQYSQQLFYKIKLLQKYISEPFFNQLRTQRKLAYYLEVRTVNNRGILGLQFQLLSSSIDPDEIARQIKLFARNHFAKLDKNLQQTEFAQLKEALIGEECGPHPNMEDYFTFICQQIQNRSFFFQRKEKLASYLKQISVGDLTQLADKIFNHSLDIMIVSKKHRKAYKKKNLNTIKNMQVIKENAKYFDDPISG